MVLLITVFCAGFATKHVLQLEQGFDLTWFIPHRTYLWKYIEQRNFYYPTLGFEAGVYMGSLNYSQEIAAIKNLTDALRSHDEFVTDFSAWVDSFKNFVLKHFSIGR